MEPRRDAPGATHVLPLAASQESPQAALQNFPTHLSGAPLDEPSAFFLIGHVDTDRQQTLRENVNVYEGVIRSFEAARARMEERRKGAIASVLVHIDESLALNRRTLDSLRQILAAAQEQLRQESLRTKSVQ